MSHWSYNQYRNDIHKKLIINDDNKDQINEYLDKPINNKKNLAEQLSMIWWEKAQRNGMMGKIPGFNATAMIFGMKNRFPRHYRDIRTNEMTGFGGGAIQIESKAKELNQLSDEQLEALEFALRPLIEGQVINEDSE